MTRYTRYERIINGVILICIAVYATNAYAQSDNILMRLKDAPYWQEQVAMGKLPPIEARLPTVPKIVTFDQQNTKIGQHGGRIYSLMAKSKDTRQMVVYGYARLIKYNQQFQLEADIAEDIIVEEGRRFIIKLRPGHYWSDGQPFTSEDFRYWWEEIANNTELYPAGPPNSLSLQGEMPKVTIVDAHTIIYEWQSPNPSFLSLLAASTPLYIYAPAHFMKQFHINYQSSDTLEELVAQYSQKSWSSLHTKMGKLYHNQVAQLPSLQPWQLVSKLPTKRMVFKRNPYYHKIDSKGQQLPYVDEWVINLVERKLIPLKAATGEVDLQGHIRKLVIDLHRN
ncbi:MAG: ABC transporter substrate-binding protein, partial [Pseudomonadota bacterium]